MRGEGSSGVAVTTRMRTVVCACGLAFFGDPNAPAPYVAAHNRSNQHRDWRALREYDDFLEGLIAEKVSA